MVHALPIDNYSHVNFKPILMYILHLPLNSSSATTRAIIKRCMSTIKKAKVDETWAVDVHTHAYYPKYMDLMKERAVLKVTKPFLLRYLFSRDVDGWR